MFGLNGAGKYGIIFETFGSDWHVELKCSKLTRKKGTANESKKSRQFDFRTAVEIFSFQDVPIALTALLVVFATGLLPVSAQNDATNRPPG